MEKEMIQNYAVENSVNVGGKRFLFCISTDENEPHPYMKCRERRETFLAHYENAIAGNDYLEVMKLYVKDISDAIAELENERLALGVENADCLKPEELIPIGEDDDIRGKVVALHERELIDGCKDIINQLYQIESGYGAINGHHQKSCTAWSLKTGKKFKVYRYEIAGIVPEDKIPEFAKKAIEQIKKEKKKSEREDR